MDGKRRTTKTATPFDNRLSRILEDIDIALMSTSSPLHRRLLNLKKNWYERDVLTFNMERGTR